MRDMSSIGNSKMYRFDEKNNLVNLSNSLLAYFTGTHLNPTLPALDAILNRKKYDKVVLMLFDGMGTSMIEKHLNARDFLRKHIAFEISSVFPPTTVAATNALLSAQYPNQTGYLGWQQYFKAPDIIVEMFTNVEPVSRVKVKGPLLSETYCPYISILDRIAETRSIHCESLYPVPIRNGTAVSFNDFFIRADHLMKNPDPHFCYCYWPEPDSLIHRYGTGHNAVRAKIKQINRKVETLVKANPDNLIIVLADHSLVDSKCFDVFEHEDFASCLKSIPSLDSRSVFFHVKEDCLDRFPLLFRKYYGDFFVLKSKKEILSENLFGFGNNHPLFEDFLGEFMATSVSEYGFAFQKDDLKAHHAGSIEEEYRISVMIFNA